MVDFKALAAPFPPEEVYWRLGSVSAAKKRGQALAYIDARVVMDRLDDVCGPAGWQCKYSHAHAKTVCDIGVLDQDDEGREWIWKADGAGDSDIEAEKGSLSDAFKRAGVRWGIGRYLYHIKSPWVEVEDTGRKNRKGEPIWEFSAAAKKELEQIARRATGEQPKASAAAPPGPRQSSAHGRALAAADPHLADTTRAKGTTTPAPINTPAAAGNAIKRIEWCKGAVDFIKGASTKDELTQWWKDNAERLGIIETALPGEHEKIIVAYDAAMDRTAARAA